MSENRYISALLRDGLRREIAKAGGDKRVRQALDRSFGSFDELPAADRKTRLSESTLQQVIDENLKALRQSGLSSSLEPQVMYVFSHLKDMTLARRDGPVISKDDEAEGAGGEHEHDAGGNAGEGAGAGGSGGPVTTSATDDDDPRDQPPPVIHGEEIDLTDDTIVVWINAFIPVNVTNGRRIPSGEFAGQIAIEGPGPVADCFLTDNRMFSKRRSASSRMHSLAVFDVSGQVPVMKQDHRCDMTVEVDCEDGDVDCRARADTHNMEWTDLQGTSKLFKVRIKAAQNNPCFPTSPDIDYEGTVTIIPESNTLIFDGKVDAFPSFEAYVHRGSRRIVSVFRRSPALGATPWNLPGPANRAVFIHVNF